MKNAVLGSLVVLAFVAQPAFAHHSFSMFDRDKQVTIKGTVKEWQFTNPHAWIEMVVDNAKGGSDVWSIECGAVSGMIREGFRQTTLKPGDQISVTLNPLKDGTHGGSLIRLTLASGKQMGQSPQPLAGPRKEITE